MTTQSEIDSLLNSYAIVSDRQVLHRAGRPGVVVTRVLIDRIAGRTFEHKFWSNWETGSHHHVDTRELVEA
jgi:hypothetical protein